MQRFAICYRIFTAHDAFNKMTVLGFFGKLPSQGDFVSRNLSYDLIESWDEWLQEVLGYSQQQLGEQWEAYFSRCPPWRIACAPGICGTQAFIGVLFPSSDRVGRRFPLLVGTPLPGEPRLTMLPLIYKDCLHQIEKLVSKALQERFDLDVFTQQLLRLDLPQQKYPNRPVSYTASITYDGYFLLQNRKDFATAVVRISSLSIGSIWWSRGNAEVNPCFVVCRTLPALERFAAFLNGDWDRLGWQRQPTTAP